MVDGPVEYTKGNRSGGDPFSAWHNIQSVFGMTDPFVADSSVAKGAQITPTGPITRLVPTTVVSAPEREAAVRRAIIEMDAAGDPQTWQQFDDQAMNQGYDLSLPARLPKGSKAYGEGSLADPKLAYTMGTPGGNQAPGPLMDPGQQAITTALTVPKKPVVQIRVPVGRPLVGTPFSGGWGAAGLGQTDWSVANQGMGGLGGLVTQSTLTPTAAPAPNAGFNLLSLFGGGYTPTVGYNGTTTVTSDELAGANKGFGGENAVMPDSMNTKRWETGY